MGTRELTPTNNNKTSELNTVVGLGKKDEAPAVHHDATQFRIAQGTGGALPQDNLSKLCRSQGVQSVQGANYVLHLQCRYGNRYVQRVLGQSRESEPEDADSPEVEEGIQQSRSGGSPLDDNTRLQMETALGADFGGVRVHTGAQADVLNRAVNARAFTTGRDVFFREGEYQPRSSNGKELLVHELTHVVQQGAAIQRKLATGQADNKYDQEKDRGSMESDLIDHADPIDHAIDHDPIDHEREVDQVLKHSASVPSLEDDRLAQRPQVMDEESEVSTNPSSSSSAVAPTSFLATEVHSVNEEVKTPSEAMAASGFEEPAQKVEEGQAARETHAQEFAAGQQAASNTKAQSMAVTGEALMSPATNNILQSDKVGKQEKPLLSSTQIQQLSESAPAPAAAIQAIHAQTKDLEALRASEATHEVADEGVAHKAMREAAEQDGTRKDTVHPAKAHQEVRKVGVEAHEGTTRALTTATPPAGGHAPVAHARGHGASHGGHGAHAGGGSAAAGGGAPASHLDAWKASVAAKTSEIQDPQLEGSAAAPGNLAQHAQSVAQQRKSERPDYQKDAHDRMPAAPQEPPREKMLDTQPADAAITSIESVGAAKLPDQTFPAMLPLPPYAGAPAGGGGSATVVPPAPAADTKAGAPGVGPDVPADAKADGVKAKVAAAAPTTAGAGPGQAVNLQDKGAASLAPLPPAQATEIGDVVARVLQDADKYAQEIVDTAFAQLDPSKKVEALAQLTKPLVAKQQDELTTELNGVAAAAGVSADQLAAKVAKQKADAAAKTEKAASELDAKSTQAKVDVQTRGTEETAAISGAGKTITDEVDRKQQAAKGEPDAAAIDAKRDSYLEKANSIAAAGLARYRASAETRATDLDRVGSEQKAAYKQRCRAEAERIKSLFPDDPIKGKIESRPVLDWGDRQVLEVDGTVARLKREATTASAQLQEPLNAAAQTARDQIRDWAASKKGTQRSWWERLFDMFMDWGSKAKADNKAWEAQRNAETRDKVAGDFDMLVRLRDEMAAGNQEAFQAEMSRLSKEQRAVVMAFIKSGGKDSIGAVAIGLIERIKAHRVPEFAKAIEEQAITVLGWKDLNLLGGAQSPGFDAGLIVRDVRGSVKGLGTDEKRLFKALQGRTPVQVAALRKAYAATYPGHDMDEDIKDDLSGSEAERATAYLSGDKTAGAIATLHDAMAGAGTDEELIMQTLRGKTPAERDAITAAYKEKYGVELKADLEDEMSDNDLDQANALVAGDTTKADAIAINEAMAGVGTDEKGINAVYSRIRDEVEADAKGKGMTTAEVNAEIKRRTMALKNAYGAKYSGGDPNQMEADFRDELSGGELNLVLAEQVNDQTAMDAAKIQIEHESLYTDDDKVNAVLIAQHDRAEKEIMRDLEVDFAEKSARMTPEERKKAREQMKEQAKGMIAERAKKNMAALKDRYDAENPEFGFQAVMDLELQGYSHDEALERIQAGGKLDDAHEIKYSIFGLGTNEARIKETLKGKSKAEIDKIKADYKALTGNDLADDIEGDMGGRDLVDTTLLLDGTKSPEEKMAYLKKRKEWEVNEGTGVLGEAFENEEEDVLERTTASAQTAYDKYQNLRKQYGENDPRTQAALEEFERWSGYSDKDIEEHRAALDSITDTIAAGVAIVAGIAVTVLTAGAAGPAVAAAAAAFGTSTTVVAAAAGAIAATAASMLTKEAMKGGSYDAEEIATDLANGTFQAIVAVGTVGMGSAALAALMKSPAFAALGEAAESGLLGRIATKGFESGIEGAIQGLPGGMMGAILNENTWKSDNPFGVIMAAGGQSSLQGAGMGAAMGGAMEGLGLTGGARAAEPVEEGAAAVHGEAPKGAGSEPNTGAATADATPLVDETSGGRTGREPSGSEASPEEGSHSGADEASAKQEPKAPRAAGEELPGGGFDDEPTLVDKAPPTVEEPTIVDHAPTAEEPVFVDQVVSEMPDETVMQAPDPKDPAQAREMYENSIKESPNREAAIYRNSETGEYIVIQGDEGTVSVGGGEAPHEGGKQQRWKEILDGVDVGRWELQAHSHPVEATTGVVDPVNQWPSGANGDMGTMATEALASGEARSSRIDYRTAEGPNHTDFGFDPAQEKPYWVEVSDGAGGRRTERFKTMEGYHDFIENTVGAPSQGDIPDHLSGTKPTAADAEPGGGKDPGAPEATKYKKGGRDFEEEGGEPRGKKGGRGELGGERGPEKDDLAQVDAVANEAGMTEAQRIEFGRFLEAEKAGGATGTKNERGDYTYRELRQKAREFMETQAIIEEGITPSSAEVGESGPANTEQGSPFTRDAAFEEVFDRYPDPLTSEPYNSHPRGDFEVIGFESEKSDVPGETRKVLVISGRQGTSIAGRVLRFSVAWNEAAGTFEDIHLASR